MPLILANPTPLPAWARRTATWACAAWVGLAAAPLQAQEASPATTADPRAAPAQGPATATASVPESGSEPTAPSRSATWEGAIGLAAQYRPEYAGADRRVIKLTPAIFLRYGRFTITNASGFVTRRADDVVRGLGVDMIQGDRFSAKLSLRVDRGRGEETSQDLAGMGDIPPTIRARLVANWRLPGPWRAGASWSVDALGRGGGNLGDVSLGWEQRVAPSTHLSVGVSLALAGDRYMQTYYGVSEEQSARTGRPVYEPRAGLRDVTASINLRQDLGPEWTLLAGLAASRQLGPAAASPLTEQRDGWSASLAAAWRF